VATGAEVPWILQVVASLVAEQGVERLRWTWRWKLAKRSREFLDDPPSARLIRRYLRRGETFALLSSGTPEAADQLRLGLIQTLAPRRISSESREVRELREATAERLVPVLLQQFLRVLDPTLRSNVRRPNTNAPVVLRVSARYSAVCAETMKTTSLPGSLYSVSPAEYHANSFSPPTPIGASGPSFGPAINPSSETESPVRTFPMMVPSSAPRFAGRCGHTKASATRRRGLTESTHLPARAPRIDTQGLTRASSETVCAGSIPTGAACDCRCLGDARRSGIARCLTPVILRPADGAARSRARRGRGLPRSTSRSATPL
jgi:hypothetical protein